MAKYDIVYATVFLMLCSFTIGEKCLSPTVQEGIYTTQESILSTDTVFIVEVTVTCQNGVKNLNLYAEINGKTVPATRTTENNIYQISVTDEHKKLPSGLYPVKFYDEEGYAALRKAQRSGEDSALEKVTPLFTVDVNHRGIWKGSYLQSEFVATIVAVLVLYFAYTTKASLQS